MPRKDDSADLTRIAIVNKDKCKPKKCKQVRAPARIRVPEVVDTLAFHEFPCAVSN